MSEIKRTPSRVEGGITKEEKIRLDAHAQMWIGRAMRTNPIEPGKIIPAIRGLYRVSGLAEPRVVIVPSPLVMAFAYGASASIWSNRTATADATRASAASAATRAATRAATDAATYAATYAATADATRVATDAATAAATDAATRVATDAAARASFKSGAADACFDLAGKEGIKTALRWFSAYQGGNMWAAYESYLSGMRDVLGLRLPVHEKYAQWELAAIQGGFRVMHERFCLVCDFPEVLRIDEQNRPHCSDGPSHRWRDGWALYHWHGVRIPDAWIRDKGFLTAKVALKCDNIEQRRCACEILGWATILRELKAKTINADADPEIGTLVEVTLPDIGKERFLRVLCGTKREFALPVPQTMKTALEAQAWTWGLKESTFVAPEVRT